MLTKILQYPSVPYFLGLVAATSNNRVEWHWLVDYVMILINISQYSRFITPKFTASFDNDCIFIYVILWIIIGTSVSIYFIKFYRKANALKTWHVLQTNTHNVIN